MNTQEHQPGVDNPDFYDTVDSVPCVVCGHRNLLDKSIQCKGSYPRHMHARYYACQGKHTKVEIDTAIEAKEGAA